MPATRIINVREFRANMTKYLNDVQNKGIHYVIMRHTTPVAKITPVPKEAYLERLVNQAAARVQEQEKPVFTARQVQQMLAMSQGGGEEGLGDGD